MAIPFKWGLESLLDTFKVFKQFRGIGRFAWGFYFTAAIASVYMLHEIFEKLKSKKRKILGVVIIIVALLLYFFEGLSYHKRASKSIVKSVNMFNKKQLPDDYTQAIKIVEEGVYQSIIPLPFFNIGSENFWRKGTSKSYTSTQTMSYHTALPIAANYLTRVSIWETKNIMQLMSPEFYEKKIGNDISSQKDFLIIYTKEDLNDIENSFLARCTKIFESKEIELWKISKEKLLSNTNKDKYMEFQEVENVLLEKNGFLLSDTTGFFFYNDFENEKNDHVFRGKGSKCFEKKRHTKLYDFEINQLEAGKKYVASFWIYNNGKNYGQDILNMLFFVSEKKNGNSTWTQVHNPANSETIFGNWSLAEMIFSVEEGVKAEIMLKGNKRSKIINYIDDLLIYPYGTKVYRVDTIAHQKKLAIFANNHKVLVDF